MVRWNQALSLIYLNIEPEFKRIVDDCSNPIEARQKLKNNFHPDSRAHHMMAFSELMESRRHNSESLNLFASRLRKFFFKGQTNR